MNQNILLITMFIILLGFWIIRRRSDTGGAAKISPKEAKKLLDSQNGVILLDVRTRNEYKEKHIRNSILIPLDAITKETNKKLKDKNAVIIVYCQAGAEAPRLPGFCQIWDILIFITWVVSSIGRMKRYQAEPDESNRTHPSRVGSLLRIILISYFL